MLPTGSLNVLVPLSRTLGLRAVQAEPAAVVLDLDHDPRLCTVGGILHGGALMTLADTAGALCAFLDLPVGAAGTTTSSRTQTYSSRFATGPSWRQRRR